MEKREILIANNRDQNKYRIVTDATTLGELQDAIYNNDGVYKMVGGSWVNNDRPIDISGLTFTEGITKTQLLSRDSALPSNVMFKGQPTNNLVMLLTNTNKNINLGATPRQEVYYLIKKYGLQETVKRKYGKNFTMVSTPSLIYEVENCPMNIHTGIRVNPKTGKEELTPWDELHKKDATKNSAQEKEKQEEKPLPDVKAAPHAATVEWFYTGIKQMAAENLLHTEDIVVLADLTKELASRLVESKPRVTVSDLEDMMKNIL